ncbi:hypothetical protein KX928_01025 [Roseobacter sp. YSTF-M11]|uniref:Uncharacterized protein n=1 Tax=Roseobacter insulae TaxID=2859783 RepID=A0A9X1K0D7_9RHOB|nr:hypothetical protein [Roseobacter insulae]MBW4706363.1 hypothetical protein [Roseobacter insulae]
MWDDNRATLIDQYHHARSLNIVPIAKTGLRRASDRRIAPCLYINERTQHMQSKTTFVLAAISFLSASGPGWSDGRHPAFFDTPYSVDWSNVEKRQNALSAMPEFMAPGARVWDWAQDESGNFVVLQEGDGSWTCFPDRPQTPSNDPMCHDPVFLEWMLANATGRTAEITSAGLSYMLQGGSAFTQDSPFITGPLDSDDWYYMGPHLMVVLPERSDWALVNRDTSTGHPVIEALALDHPILLFPVAAPDQGITTHGLQ